MYESRTAPKGMVLEARGDELAANHAENWSFPADRSLL